MTAMDVDVPAGVDDPNVPAYYPEELKAFYKRLFPFEKMYDWLSYGDKDYFARREFTYTFDSIFSRYHCYNDVQTWARKFRASNPERMDIGAVFNIQPNKLNKMRPEALVAQQKELVFDVDMDDFNDVRSNIDNSLPGIRNDWAFMTITVKVLDRALREDFGFEHLLWVYSGRRGVHCWVCDKRARELSEHARKAVVSYLKAVVVVDSDKPQQPKINNQLHPLFARTYDTILLPYFENHVILEQRLFEEQDNWNRLLSFCGYPDIAKQLDKDFSSQEKTPEERWASTKASLLNAYNKDLKSRKRPPCNPVHKIVMAYTWPRLDENVSYKLNHLLKSPFVVHPKTGKVCVPFDPSTCENFDLNDVPNVRTLMSEMSPPGEAKEGQDYKTTSLKKSMKVFQDFLSKLNRSQRSEAANDSMEF